jgi:hypothetical protein
MGALERDVGSVMYFVERVLFAALLGLPFTLKWPERASRPVPLIMCIALATVGVWPATHGLLIAATGMLGSLTIMWGETLEDGLASAGILFIIGAIGLAIGQGSFVLATTVALGGLIGLVFFKR